MMRSIRRWGMLGVASAIALIGASCTGGATGGGTTEQAAAGPATVEVMLSEFAIDPSAIAVPVGQPIEFSVMNMGQAPHTFAVDAPAPRTRPSSSTQVRPSSWRFPPSTPGLPGVLHGVRTQGPRHAGHGHGGNGRSRRRSHRVELRRPGNRGPRNQYERGDDGVDAQGGCRRIPRGQPDTDRGEPALGTHDGRHHEGLRAHGVQREVGGVEGAVRGCDGVQRSDPGPGDRRRVRRPHPDRGREPARPADRPPLPRDDRAERAGRRAVHHAGPDHARPGVDVRVHREGPTGHVRLPLALQLDGAGGCRAVRRADRAAEGGTGALRVYGATPWRARDVDDDRRCSWATARSGTCSTARRSRRRRRSSRSRAIGC